MASIITVLTACTEDDGGPPQPLPSPNPAPNPGPSLTVSELLQRAQEYTKNVCFSEGYDDCDFDGIVNQLDKMPYLPAPVDVDGDLALNYEDRNPYDFDRDLYDDRVRAAAPTTGTQVTPPSAAEIFPVLPPRIYTSSLTADSDSDLVPDYLDSYEGDDYGDDDRDGLTNNRDPWALDPDIDNDGSVDGVDRSPRDPNVGSRTDERLEAQMLEQRREAARLEESHLQQQYEKDRLDRERLDDARDEEDTF